MGKKIKIVLDAGHGGHDPGAVANGMRESDINLEVTNELYHILKATKLFKLKRTRKKNVFVTIGDRWRKANHWDADYFISIHSNAGGGTGVETIIPTASPNNPRRDLQETRRFAEIMSNTLGNAFNMRVRRANGVMLETETGHRVLGVLRNTAMPAILVELAFMDSPLHNPDVAILRYQRRELAEALAKGILDYLGIVDFGGTYMTQKEFNKKADRWLAERTRLPESQWSKNEGFWRLARFLGVFNTESPQRLITGEQFAAVLGRLGLLDKFE